MAKAKYIINANLRLFILSSSSRIILTIIFVFPSYRLYYQIPKRQSFERFTSMSGFDHTLFRRFPFDCAGYLINFALAFPNCNTLFCNPSYGNLMWNYQKRGCPTCSIWIMVTDLCNFGILFCRCEMMAIFFSLFWVEGERTKRRTW